jgi:hypothetical protein
MHTLTEHFALHTTELLNLQEKETMLHVHPTARTNGLVMELEKTSA